MIPALILVASAAALVQFAVLYWRSLLVAVASQEISERTQDAVGRKRKALSGEDFRALLALHRACPEVAQKPESLGAVRAYYCLMRGMDRLCRLLLPPVAIWARNEMLTCCRYVAVRLDERLARNQACLVEMLPH